MFFIVIFFIYMHILCANTHRVQMYTIYLLNKKNRREKYAFMPLNIIIVILNILFDKYINRHVIDLFNFFLQYQMPE